MIHLKAFMSKTNFIQVFEHQKIDVLYDYKFKQQHFKSLIKFGERTNFKYFQVINNKIKFNNYVGVIQINSLNIEVLPKADKTQNNDDSKAMWHNVLIQMLVESKKLKLDAISNAQLKLKIESLLDLYIDVFLSEVEIIIQNNLKKNYKAIEGNLLKVKGRINFGKNIQLNNVHKERCYTSHIVYNSDNIFNQILYKALNILSNFCNNSTNQLRIRKIKYYFEGISNIAITQQLFNNICYDRTSERYREAINIAKLIILQNNPDISSGNQDILSILFDMNLLFEKFICKRIKKAAKDFSELELKVDSQQSKLFWKNRSLRPDIILEFNKNGVYKKVILDTKWKILKHSMPSDDDLKQIYTYNIHFGAESGVLLYPNCLNLNSQNVYHHSNLLNKDISHSCGLMFVNILDEFGQLNKTLGSEIIRSITLN